MRYFTVGPSELYPSVRDHMREALERDIPSLSHRSADFNALVREAREALVPLFRVDPSYAVFYAGSATEWMERAVQNLSATRTLHFVAGTFSERFYAFAQEMGRDAYKVRQRDDGSFSFNDIPPGFEPEMIALTHNETSNGTMLSPSFFTAVKERYPHALIALDVVSSAPVYPDIFATADMLFVSVQKGFGLPAGLGVALVSPRAIERSAEVAHTGAYTGGFHALSHLAKDAVLDQTPETPNVMNIFLLSKVAKELLSVGVDSLTAQTTAKAAMLYEALARSSDTVLEPFIEEHRSLTTIVARAPGGSKPIIDRLKGEGFLIHTGYGERKDTHVRIANFSAHSKEDVERLCALL